MDGWEEQCQVGFYIHCTLTCVVPSLPRKELVCLYIIEIYLKVKHMLSYYGHPSFSVNSEDKCWYRLWGVLPVPVSCHHTKTERL